MTHLFPIGFGPRTFGPPKWVPLDKWSLEYSVYPGGQAVDIWKYGTELVEDHLSRGIKFLGTICPWGPHLLETIFPGGSILWGSFVQGDRKSGTGSPGIKWVRERNHGKNHEFWKFDAKHSAFVMTWTDP